LACSGTTINTPDNVQTIVGNGAIFSHPELFGQPISSRGSDCHDQQRRGPHQAIRLLKDRLARIPNVLSAPAPDVDIVQFTPAGPLLCVRPYCNHQHYWQVYFETIA
jgi:small conductance mechanosensitive channel